MSSRDDERGASGRYLGFGADPKVYEALATIVLKTGEARVGGAVA